MSGGANTSVSGMRSPGGSRRGDTARISKGVSGGSITVHIIILGLAVLLWWIARDMVSVSQQLTNAGRVRFELSQELQGRWRVFSQATVPVSLDVSGPTKEINDFAADLEQNPGRFAYRYEITEADIANLPVSSRHQITLTLDIRRLEATSEAVAPPELRVRPLGAASGEKGGTFNVTLERYIERPAYVDLGASAKGQIQVTLVRRDGRNETRAYSFTAEAKLDKEIEMWGPASLIDANSDSNGQGRLKVSIDAKQALENFAKSKDLTLEQVLDQGSLVSNVQLLPIEGISIRDTQDLEVAFVNVRITYVRVQDYVPVSADLPVEPIFPNWLAQKKAYVANLPSSIPVDMRVLNSQRDAFNQEHVHVRIDLSDLVRADLTIEDVENSNLKRARVLNRYYSLSINTDRLTYEFVNENVTAELYQPASEIVIEWTED
jgi:hypothetical protein